jgi:hypothetical protein
MYDDMKSGCRPAKPLILAALALAASAFPHAAAMAEPAAIAAGASETLLAIVHAEGVQVYECTSDEAGMLGWRFREPIATLLEDGTTAGRHYAGPSWEFTDGSAVSAVVVAKASGAGERDIPLLKLKVTSRRGSSPLAATTTIQRLNTRGGMAEGSCETAGAYLSVPYAADYAFFGSALAGTIQTRWPPGPYDYLFEKPDARSAGQALTTVRREAQPEGRSR